jgi:peptidoglycan/xylan/chitin deacetylase (PgdA/CDA1 family)
MRFDKSITLCVQAINKLFGWSGNGAFPILMYHAIDSDIHFQGHPYFETVTSPLNFKRHLMLLKELGFSSIGLNESIASATERSLLISFDDGFEDFYSQAFPILQETGYSAVVYLPVRFIGKNSKGIEGRQHLNWNQVRELHRWGVSFGSHSIDHLDLACQSPQELKKQITFSKSEIENQLGAPIISFSHPFAFPDGDRNYIKRYRSELFDAGYRHGVTTKIGLSRPSDDPLLQRRIPCNEYDDNSFLLAKLHGAYDWLYGFQLMKKKVKQFLSHN